MFVEYQFLPARCIYCCIDLSRSMTYFKSIHKSWKYDYTSYSNLIKKLQGYILQVCVVKMNGILNNLLNVQNKMGEVRTLSFLTISKYRAKTLRWREILDRLGESILSRWWSSLRVHLIWQQLILVLEIKLNRYCINYAK